MGLDQYAGYRDSNGEVHEEFHWRKHARLQVFFNKEYKKQNKPAPLEADQGGFGDLSHLGFNGGMGGVKITEELVNRLEEEHMNDYWNCFASDGFFWGQQFQEDAVKEYKAQDKKFIDWCREQLKKGKDIGYDCSW